MEMLDEQNDSDKLLELQKDMDSIYKELYDVKSQLSRKITEPKAKESKSKLKNSNQNFRALFETILASNVTMNNI